MIEPLFNQSTLASFIQLFEKEMKESESVREAHKFSRLALKLVGSVPDDLINSALKVSSGIYKAWKSSSPVWWEEVLEELALFRTKLPETSLVADLKRQCDLLKKTVGEKVKRR